MLKIESENGDILETILVTGGAGFIGSHLIEQLLQEGHPVICLDTLDDFYDINQKKQNLLLFQNNPLFHFYHGSICDHALLENIFSSYLIKKVVHLAAKAGVRQSIKNPEAYVDINTKGTITLLDIAVKYNCTKFVFASSSSVYGQDAAFPLTESEKNLEPCSPYAITKRNAELFCSYYARHFQLPLVVLRFFTVYGPRGRPDMATFKFIEAILHDAPIEIFGDGTIQRDFTYVKDTVLGICAALEQETRYGIFNISSGNPVSLNSYVQLIGEIIGKKPNITFKDRNKLDVEKTHADISKAMRLLGYAPHFSLKKGLSATIEWHKTKQKVTESLHHN